LCQIIYCRVKLRSAFVLFSIEVKGVISILTMVKENSIRKLDTGLTVVDISCVAIKFTVKEKGVYVFNKSKGKVRNDIWSICLDTLEPFGF
jgi:arginine deiminase